MDTSIKMGRTRVRTRLLTKHYSRRASRRKWKSIIEPEAYSKRAKVRVLILGLGSQEQEFPTSLISWEWLMANLIWKNLRSWAQQSKSLRRQVRFYKILIAVILGQKIQNQADFGASKNCFPGKFLTIWALIRIFLEVELKLNICHHQSIFTNLTSLPRESRSKKPIFAELSLMWSKV